jgi:hypothetical protein
MTAEHVDVKDPQESNQFHNADIYVGSNRSCTSS